MEKKGWNLDYLSKKIEKCREEPSSLEDLEVYQLLLCTLLFQEGEVEEEEVDLSSSLELLSGLSNPYHYSSSVQRNCSSIARQMLGFDGISPSSCSSKISHEEALSLVGDFIQSEFGVSHLKVYQEFFLHRSEYVLFDRISDLSAVTITKEGERFIQIRDTRDVDMVSKIAHEAGHVYRSWIYSYPEKEHILGEFESFSYELRLLQWMMKQHLYEEDATNCFLQSMRLLENLTILSYLDRCYHFHLMKSPSKLEERVQQLGLLSRTKESSLSSLLDYLYSVLQMNHPTYLYSYLAVLQQWDVPSYLENYEWIVRNLDKKKPSSILQKVCRDPITNLTSYEKKRKILMKNG